MENKHIVIYELDIVKENKEYYANKNISFVRKNI